MKFNRIVIAGSRGFDDYTHLCEYMEAFEEVYGIVPEETEFVCGEARGADTLGKKWAQERGYEVVSFPADWDTYGKSAGYKRNEQMAQYATCLIAFWDGKSKGTAHMIRLAEEHGLNIYIEMMKETCP